MKPVTYGRRAAKRTRPPIVEESNNGRQISYERTAKRAKALANVSPVSTDVEEDHSLMNSNNNQPTKPAIPPFKLIGKAVHRTSSKASERGQPSTPPADIPPSTSAKSSITYLSRNSTKSRGSPDGDTPPGEAAKSPPKTLVKDLSGLFQFASASDPQSTGTSVPRSTGIAKRMLSRSHTTSSTGSSSLSGSLDSIKDESASRQLSHDRVDTIIDLTVASTVTSSSNGFSKLTKPSFDDISPPITAQSSAIRTYAGSSRSFVFTLPASQFVSSNSQSSNDVEKLLESQEDLEVHETYSDLRARWGVDNSEDDPHPLSYDHQSPSGKGKRKIREIRPPTFIPNGSNDLKSITELRNKGESRRFQDEVGYLFEGLDPKSSLSVRRGSTLEIILKFSDLEFARKAKVADFTVQAWETLRGAGAGDGDKVLDSALVVFTAFVTRDVRDLIDLANRTNAAAVLFKILGSLGYQNDPLGLVNSGLTDTELKKAGIARTEKALLGNFNRLISKKFDILSEGALVSNRLLITTILASLPPSFHRSEYILILLDSLISEISLVPPRVSGYTSGLSLLPPTSPTYYLDTPAFAHIENCLRLLEAFLLNRWTIANDDGHSPDPLSTRRDALVKGLVASCIAADILMRDPGCEDMSTLARKCLESALRVLVNLSHNNEPWCESLLQEEYTVPMIMRFIMTAHKQRRSSSQIMRGKQDTEAASSSEEIDVHAFDRLCLTLGLLTNLVQVDERAKELSRETLLNISCANKRPCIRACACPQRVSALECLVTVYLQHCKASSEDEIDPIIRGHISILFGLFMRHNVANQRTILAALPGSTTRSKLTPLVETAQEFVDLYDEVMTRIARVESVETGYEAGDDIPNTVQQERDQSGESLALDIVSFLKTLSQSPDS